MIDYEQNLNHQINLHTSSSPDLLLGINGADTPHKKKRRPAGTPDPDAEVISLSPRTLLESDRYICEICNQGFQRDQNLQMHKRRHKVPWKLLKREKKDEEMRKKVYVCPEPKCLHHDPCHALGDLVGIKKHFRRKHSVHKQWVCERCSKGYAVQSDYKSHLKTCGSRGHSCDCGRVFSRVESFIQHQDICTIGKPPRTNHRLQQHTAGVSAPLRTTSTASIGPLLHGLPMLRPPPRSDQHSTVFSYPFNDSAAPFESLELQLSIGMARTAVQEKNSEKGETNLPKERAKDEARKAEEMRQEAKRQIEMAETDFEKAKRIRKEATAELEKAQIVREEAIKRVSATMMEISCHSCKQLFHLPVMADESTSSLVMSYVSSATTEGECERSNMCLYIPIRKKNNNDF